MNLTKENINQFDENINKYYFHNIRTGKVTNEVTDKTEQNKVCSFSNNTKRQSLPTLVKEEGSRKVNLAGIYFWKYTVHILTEEDSYGRNIKIFINTNSPITMLYGQ